MLEVIRAASPYPTIREDGELFDGLLLPQSKKCHQCVERSCRSHIENLSGPRQVSHFVCRYGLSVVVLPTSVGTLLINGVYVPSHNTLMSRQMRKAHRPRKVAMPTISKFWQAIKNSEARILEAIDHRTTYAVSGIHDIRTAVRDCPIRGWDCV
jgi:hypothetical protein